MLEESAESLMLARLYIASGAMPANGERRRQINATCLRENLALLDIVSPWEIVDEEFSAPTGETEEPVAGVDS